MLFRRSSKTSQKLTSLFLGQFSGALAFTSCSPLRMLARPMVITPRNDRAFRMRIDPMTFFLVHVCNIVKLSPKKQVVRMPTSPNITTMQHP